MKNREKIRSKNKINLQASSQVKCSVDLVEAGKDYFTHIHTHEHLTIRSIHLKKPKHKAYLISSRNSIHFAQPTHNSKLLQVHNSLNFYFFVQTIATRRLATLQEHHTLKNRVALREEKFLFVQLLRRHTF